jgi:dihydroorotase
MLLIKNGRVADPASRLVRAADLLVRGGKIAPLSDLPPGAAPSVLDASGCIVAPGLVDMHVHFRDPGFLHKEDVFNRRPGCRGGRFHNCCCHAQHRPRTG